MNKDKEFDYDYTEYVAKKQSEVDYNCRLTRREKSKIEVELYDLFRLDR